MSILTSMLWLVAQVTTATTGGVALSHVLEVPGKHLLRPADVARVQQGLYPGFRTFGMIAEPLALLSTVALAVATVAAGAGGAGTAVAAALTYVAMGLVFPLLTQPMNRRIARWDPADLPDRWRDTLHRWEASHALRAALMLLSAVLLAVSALLAT